MNLRLDISGATGLLSALQRFPQETEADVHGAVVDSAGMIQVRARAVHRFISRTGNAERNTLTRFPDRMTGEVYLDTRNAPELRFIHEGTKPHPILPKNKKRLRWATPGGGWAFAGRVNHPGTKPDQFLYEAAATEQSAVVERFGRAVQAAKQRVGL